jgi:catechol 2,3-dioxygenase-like lactoylglutathione lyase family enzyme
MELASYLAGARWSDHPACTHPLLASLARLVNDHTSDAGRNELAGLVPSVIGLTSDDPHVDVRIALRAATTALPIAAAERQRVLAVSVLSAERVLDALDGRPAGSLEERSRWALAQVPDAADWARSFIRENRTGSARNFHRYAAPNTVRYAVGGIAHACVPDPDGILRDLLAGAIADCAQLIRGDTPAKRTPDLAAWAAACRLTGAAGRHDQ